MIAPCVAQGRVLIYIAGKGEGMEVTMERPVQILELFGGIGSPRCALRNLEFARNMQEKKRLQKELEKMTERYTVAMEYVPSYMQRKVRKELGEETAEDRQQTALDSFIKRMTDEEKHTTEDYGWLEPDGTFHEVEWCKHQNWATEYIKKTIPEPGEGDLEGRCKYRDTVSKAGDYLTERGWVLLHNPTQGIAKPTKNLFKPYTKAQKEFLYDYYMERNCKTEADEIWQEDDE